jgi:hypothetical protein
MRMRYVHAAPLAAVLALAGCVPPDDGLVRTDTTPSVAFQGARPIDFERGIWGTQPVTPPPGLVLVRQGHLIGRPVEDSAGNAIAWVEYLLIEPATAEARYAVAASNRFGDYVAIPLSAARVTPSTLVVDATERNLVLAPKFTVAELERRYPRTAVARAPFAPLPPVAGPAPLPPVAEPLQLVRRGSVVGYPVVDSIGHPVGTVEAVAAVPATGEVRYAVISGPSIGFGQYIVVPATTTSAAAGRVTLIGPPTQWATAPRYRGDQVQQNFGALGTVN